jgi:hypothetical protein
MKLIVEPGQSSTRNHFCATTPAHSVALDWYVKHAPIVNIQTKHFNFDHHTWVDRLATRSTMGQVYFAIKQWLFDCLSYAEGTIYVNDADQDVCLSSWLLTYQNELKDWVVDKKIKQLIELQDPLDVTWWMYRVNPNSALVQTSAWIFEPYVKARISGVLNSMDADQMDYLIRTIWKRLFVYVENSAEQVALDTRYSVLGWGKWRSMIEETWYDARMQLMFDWISAFVSAKQLEHDTWQYSIWKISPFINFPITKLYSVLTQAEWIPDINEWWGWSDLIGWSSRKLNSVLSPEEVEKIINNELAK